MAWLSLPWEAVSLWKMKEVALSGTNNNIQNKKSSYEKKEKEGEEEEVTLELS